MYGLDSICIEDKCLTKIVGPFAIVNLVIMFLHIMHINVLVNLRLQLQRSSVLFSICWKPINWIICKFGQPDEKFKGVQFLCRDRCITSITLIKYVVLIPLFVYPGS